MPGSEHKRGRSELVLPLQLGCKQAGSLALQCRHAMPATQRSNAMLQQEVLQSPDIRSGQTKPQLMVAGVRRRNLGARQWQMRNSAHVSCQRAKP